MSRGSVKNATADAAALELAKSFGFWAIGARSRVMPVPDSGFLHRPSLRQILPHKRLDLPTIEGSFSLYTWERASMPGTLVTLLREPGERVEKGRPALVMEAMKMEHTIAPPPPVRCRYPSFNPSTW